MTPTCTRSFALCVRTGSARVARPLKSAPEMAAVDAVCTNCLRFICTFILPCSPLSDSVAPLGYTWHLRRHIFPLQRTPMHGSTVRRPGCYIHLPRDKNRAVLRQCRHKLRAAPFPFYKKNVRESIACSRRGIHNTDQ